MCRSKQLGSGKKLIAAKERSIRNQTTPGNMYLKGMRGLWSGVAHDVERLRKIILKTAMPLPKLQQYS